MKKRDKKEVVLVVVTVIAAILIEAATYQKDFAEHHEYVIVKMDKKYNVYNMEPIENDTQTVQKSE